MRLKMACLRTASAYALPTALPPIVRSRVDAFVWVASKR
jgi:hypothetical protein